MLFYLLYALLFLRAATAASVELDSVVSVDGNEETGTNLENISELRRLYPGYFSNWNPFSWTRYEEEENEDNQLKKIRTIQKALFDIIKCVAIENIGCDELVIKTESLFDEKKKKKKKNQTTTTPTTTKATTARSTTTTNKPVATTTTSTGTTSSSSKPSTAPGDEQNATSEPTTTAA